jgi:hypothetical protein
LNEPIRNAAKTTTGIFSSSQSARSNGAMASGIQSASYRTVNYSQ